MNDLKELIRNARKLQKITDEAVIKALNELESICKNNKYDYTGEVFFEVSEAVYNDYAVGDWFDSQNLKSE